MIKPTLLVKLLKARLLKREAYLIDGQAVSDSYDEGTRTAYTDIAQAGVEGELKGVQDEITFLKTVLKEATHDYSP